MSTAPDHGTPATGAPHDAPDLTGVRAPSMRWGMPTSGCSSSVTSYSAEEYRGRVVAVWFMQFALVSPGTFGVGVLAEWIGPQLAIGGLAAAMLVVMTGVALWVPRMQHLE